MTSALWSCNTRMAMDYPARYLVAFMQNHHMMQMTDRPIWKTVSGGSRSYIDAMLSKNRFTVLTNEAVQRVDRDATGVDVHTATGSQRFDRVVFACHGDQALAMLSSPSPEETAQLSKIQYQHNRMNLHSDPSVMPKRRQAWASWNMIMDSASQTQCTVSYYMNLLQSIDSSTPLIVSLNMEDRIDPNLIWGTRDYEHPIYTRETVEAAQVIRQWPVMQHSVFAGAYLGWGFHEDGTRSGVEAAQKILMEVARAA